MSPTGIHSTTEYPSRLNAGVSARSLRFEQLWVLGWCSFALLLAVSEAYTYRHQLNPDGVAYIDIADAYLEGDWRGAINGHWSPLYSVVLAAAIAIVRPGPYWEFALIHGVNVLVFGLALSSLLTLLRAIQKVEPDRELMGLPRWSWLAAAIGLLTWSSLQWVNLGLATPDLLMTACLLLASALLLRVRMDSARLKDCAFFGVSLGLGYLAKAPMLPIALLMMALVFVSRRPWRQSARRVTWALAAFAIVAGPYIAALSWTKGRLTFGESRIVSSAWFRGIPYRHWQGDASNTLDHPTRLVVEKPATFEFATPLRGTYPVWYDPSYWYEGVNVGWSLRSTVVAVFTGLREYYELVAVHLNGVLFTGLLIVAGYGWPQRSRWRPPASWPLAAVGVAGLCMYLPVAVLPRYAAPFLMLAWLGALDAMRLPRSTESSRLLTATGGAMVIGVALSLVVGFAPRVGRAAADFANGESLADHSQWAVAARLHDRGLRQGDRIAQVHPFGTSATWSGMMAWARVGRFRIVADVPPESAPDYWSASADQRDAVHAAFRSAGAVAAVTCSPPGDADLSSWASVDGTNCYVMFLRHE